MYISAEIPSQLKFEKSSLKNLNSPNRWFDKNNITAICVDNSGLIWLGSEEGSVFTYDSQKKKVTDLSNVFDMLEESIFNIVNRSIRAYMDFYQQTGYRIRTEERRNYGLFYYG